MRVLLTGHTGFKGAWLLVWLRELGAHISGIALEPERPSLFDDLGLARECHHAIVDVRDPTSTEDAVRAARADVVFHLAAQPLVRRAHADPLVTVATNVLGTSHVLEAVRRCGGARAVVVVTTDKVYAPRTGRPYRETDPLGGDEPYGASKAAAEHIAAAYRGAYGLPIATARAGNVIGGGDRAADRLLPDAIRALSEGRAIPVRNPDMTRPWQHVLEPLGGYLTLAARLVRGDAVAEAWNLGPSGSSPSVREVVERVIAHWGQGTWIAAPDPGPREGPTLELDATKARERLGWIPRWDLDRAIARTVQWYRVRLGETRPASLRRVLVDQIAEYAESEAVAT